MKTIRHHFNRKNSINGVWVGIGFYAFVKVFRFAFSNEVIAWNLVLMNEVWKFALLGIAFVVLHQYNLGRIKNALSRGSTNTFLILFISLGNGLTFVPIVFLMRFIVSTYPLAQFYQEENSITYLIAFLVASLTTLAFYSYYTHQQTQKQKIKEQTFLAGSATARFDALKNQLDPHFLFNSLNVLTSLIEENPSLAQKFTTSLSKVYRYVLEQKNKDLVTLDEELDFARTYVSLLKMRFENSIIFEIPDRATNPEALLVPLSLQLLLENTVKHNKVNPGHPLHIKIYEMDGNLVVENKLQPKEVLGKSSGFGLQNIQQRYHILSSRKVHIEKTNTHFRVQLPLLTKTIPIMTHQNSGDSYIRARKKVEELKEFYSSLASYVVVIPFLIFINYRTYWEFQWFWFPALGWGIGLAFHAFKVYGPGWSWEERKLRQFMEEEKNKTKWH
ncbi:histidine kinase [Arenibacter sp. GZD96]|uniref:histidine kinase n=1 Tax=Aurantibrevibacter litoralis TaxID=3106030 RepID=UPI002AFFE462|nr:histidine kinase [Arenibacter sp. GZD-96]MEA1786133.1 histidine kinase [Arenibacter sp. GZD-96]